MNYSLPKRIRFHQAASATPNSLLSRLGDLPPSEVSKLFHMAILGGHSKGDVDFLSKWCNLGETCQMALPEVIQSRDIPIPNDLVSWCFSFLSLPRVGVCATVSRRWCAVSLMPSSYQIVYINRRAKADVRRFVLDEYCKRFSMVKMLTIKDADRAFGSRNFTEHLTKTKSLRTLRLHGNLSLWDCAFALQNSTTLQVLDSEFVMILILHLFPNLKLVKLSRAPIRRTGVPHRLGWSDVHIPADPCPSIQGLEILEDISTAPIDTFLSKFPNIRFFGTSTYQTGFPIDCISKLSSLPKLQFLRIFKIRVNNTTVDSDTKTLENVFKHSQLSHVQFSFLGRFSLGPFNTHGVKFEKIIRGNRDSPRHFGIVSGRNLHITCDKVGDVVF